MRITLPFIIEKLLPAEEQECLARVTASSDEVTEVWQVEDV